MEIELTRIDDDFHFVGRGSSEVSVHIDGSPDIGGHNAGARPMELLLMGLGGCSGIDVVLILKKQRQTVTGLRIVVSGQRQQEADTLRKPFSSINLHFELAGPALDPDKVERAVRLSIEKYCSATAQFESTAAITHTVALIESL